jgi:type II secretory pathway pseudopilin PulG
MKLGHEMRVADDGSRAFTLIEVILAIGIAIGILVVGLYFHSQATNLRAQLLLESDRISTVRLVMDRLTSEMRNAFAQPQYGFTGDATSLRFVTVEAPAPAAWNAFTPRAAWRGDLRLVTYGLGKNLEGTNQIVTGLTRTEELLLEKPTGPNASATTVTLDSTNALAPGVELLTDSIRFLRIWYWDGYGWLPTWDSDQLPRGIEITLGAEPLAADALPADYAGEFFRRVIYLPTSREIEPMDWNDATEGTSALIHSKP